MLVSTTYFGNIAFWQEIAASNTVSIDCAEHYQKQSFRNRTTILSANGLLNLSIPVIRKDGSKTKVEDIIISNTEDWRKDHWKAIESAYKHAPYFWYYGDLIKEIIYADKEYLLDYNLNSIKALSSYFDFNIQFKFQKEYIAYTGENDNRILLNKKNQKINQNNYIQVFSDKLNFQSNLSALDILFNEGQIAHNLLIIKK